MITKLASAALVTLALGGLAAAGDQVSTTLRFDAAAGQSEAGRAAMLDDIARAARDACTRTGTHLRDGDCEAAFALSAINSIGRPDLRAALLQDHLGAAAPGVAVAQAPGN
jgi:hypothetical protein